MEIRVNAPLSVRRVAVLAVLNDPDLIAARAQHNMAQAELLSAGLLPDAVISGGFTALIGGPGDASAISGSLMQDVSALITYSVNRKGPMPNWRKSMPVSFGTNGMSQSAPSSTTKRY
jgi:hypothetical protein